MLDPWCLSTLWIFSACYRDSFTYKLSVLHYWKTAESSKTLVLVSTITIFGRPVLWPSAPSVRCNTGLIVVSGSVPGFYRHRAASISNSRPFWTHAYTNPLPERDVSAPNSVASCHLLLCWAFRRLRIVFIFSGAIKLKALSYALQSLVNLLEEQYNIWLCHICTEIKLALNGEAMESYRVVRRRNLHIF
jgi:hypothetical protein